MKLQTLIFGAAASALLLCTGASSATAENRHGMAPSRQMMHHRMHRPMSRDRMMHHRMMHHRMMHRHMMHNKMM